MQGPWVRLRGLAPWWDRLVYAAIALVVAAHWWWLSHFRSGGGLEQDEARILPLAYLVRQDYHLNGFTGFWRAWSHWPIIAPVLATAASPFAHEGARQYSLWVVELPFVALLMLATYELGKDLGGRVAATAAVLVVSVVPATVWFTRTLQQIVPGAALWTAAVLCAVRSDALTRRGWRVALGVIVGVALITRTMLIAFIPALPLILGVQILLRPRDRRPRPRALVETVAPAVVIAATWWAPQWRSALDYLGSGGYTDAVAAHSSRFGSQYWPAGLMLTPGVRLLLIGLLLAAAGLAVATVVSARRASGGAGEGRAGEAVRRFLTSPEALVWGVLAWGIAALASSANNFPGFQLLNIPVAAVLGLSILRMPRTRPILLVLALVLAGPIWRFGSGNSSWYAYVARRDGVATPGVPIYGPQWADHAFATAGWIDRFAQAHHVRPTILVVNGHALYTANQIYIGFLQAGAQPYVIRAWPSSFSARDLNGSAADAGLVDLVTPPPGTRAVGFDLAAIETALRADGFVLERSTTLPNGGRERIWWSPRRAHS